MQHGEVTVKTGDGFELAGLFEAPESESNACVVLCHGLTVDREELGVFTKLAKRLVDEGFHTFRFDFRGHGKSRTREGLEYSVTGSLKDLEAVMGFLRERGYKTFILVGASFGGGAVAMYGGNHPEGIEAVIMWNALIDYEEKIHPTTERNKRVWGEGARDEIEQKGFIEKSRGMKFSKEAFEEFYTLKPYESLLKFKKPVLFIHGDADEHVLYDNSVKYSGMMDNAELITIEGAPHGFQVEEDGDKACQAAVDFVKKVL